MVTKLRSEDVAKLYDLRIAIEPQLAPHIVDLARAAGLDRLTRASDTMVGARERDPVALADRIRAHLTGARDDLLALYKRPDTQNRVEQLRNLRS